jgi:hypothetical protein
MELYERWREEGVFACELRYHTVREIPWLLYRERLRFV